LDLRRDRTQNPGEIVQRQIVAVHSIAQTGPELRVILQNGAEPRSLSIENAIALIEKG
jgi:hypothetical protein